MILERIIPAVLSVRRLPNADPRARARLRRRSDQAHLARARHLRSRRCDVRRARRGDQARADRRDLRKSFYAGAAHGSGRLSGEILGVIAAAEPEAIEDGLEALLRCLAHDACFYDADGKRTVTVFPHVIAALGEYLSREAGLAPGAPMAYLVAPPMEATIGARCGAQGRGGPRGADHPAADRDQLRLRMADRRPRCVRGRGGGVCGGGRRCRRDAQALTPDTQAFLGGTTPIGSTTFASQVQAASAQDSLIGFVLADKYRRAAPDRPRRHGDRVRGRARRARQARRDQADAGEVRQRYRGRGRGSSARRSPPAGSATLTSSMSATSAPVRTAGRSW